MRVIISARALVFGFFLSCALQAFGVAIIGHRGARGLLPENTLPAISKAIALDVDYVDMDVAMTADGVLIVYHDLFLNPNITRDEYGHWISPHQRILIKQLSLAQIKHYDVGQINPSSDYAKLFPAQLSIPHTPIPTLKEAIDLIQATAPKTIQLQIEIKSDPTQPEWNMPTAQMVQTLSDLLIAEHMVDRTKVQSFDWGCLQALQSINPQIATAYLTDEDLEHTMRNPNPQIAGRWSGGHLLQDYHDSLPDMIKALGGQWWDAQDTEITSKDIEKSHALGLKVAIWSWPERHLEERLSLQSFLAMQIDAIITDRPDLMQ